MRRLVPSLLALAVLAAPPAVSAREAATKAPPTYNPPPETSRLIEGPGVDLARRYCMACHSADYISTQPPHMPPAFWAGEVAKMRNNYGAPVPDDAAKAITDYLVATYTEPSAGRK